MTPAERLEASSRLWQTYLERGGSLDPEPDPRSPFYDPAEWRALAADGGQACVVYGGAELSRDADILVVADAANLGRLRAAVADLKADVIAVPPFERRFLEAGHAVPFRCRVAEAQGIRLDVMSRLRGLPDFETVWERRTTLETGVHRIDVLSLPDLVAAKKTQQDKDWPMIARLLEAHYARHAAAPDDLHVEFWLRELRSPTILIDIARSASQACARLRNARPLLEHGAAGHEPALVAALRAEEDAEREADRRSWAPLKRELEQLRRGR